MLTFSFAPPTKPHPQHRSPTLGADIKTSQYTSILTDLQEAVDFPLWVGIPQCLENIAAIPGTLSSGIDRVSKTLSSQGMPPPGFTFFGGHSLGGAMIPDYVAGLESDAPRDGMFLLGSFLTRKYKSAKTSEGRPQFSFPVPTLTVGGELDGLCRLTRIAESLYTQVTFSDDPEAASLYMPVTVVAGMNHMQFASGDAPSFVSGSDLKSALTEDEAHASVVADVSAFLSAVVSPSDLSSSKFLQQRAKESRDLTQPVVDALKLEGYAQFLPPCYCENEDEYGGLQYGVCPSTSTCTGGCPWTEQYSQPLMVGLHEVESAGLGVRVVDTLHLVTETSPSCHLPHIHGNPVDNAIPGHLEVPPICESPSGGGGGCTLDITTITQHVYDNSGEVDIWRAHFQVPWIDTGYLPISANELKTKLKSRQAIWEAAGIEALNFTHTDTAVEAGGEEDRCGEINQAAVDWAYGQLSAEQKERYDTYGQKLLIKGDIGTCIAGPCWIWDPLRFKEDDDKNTVDVQSVWFATENEVAKFSCGEGKLLPCSAGFHYCKILSPARALEWMLVDGLKNKMGLSK